MKKILCFIFSILLLLSYVNVVFANDAIIVQIDGKQVAFDVPPQLINDRTMVPLRAIFEGLGATVNWNDNTQTIISSKGNTTIVLTIDSPTMYVNGKNVTLDSPACLIDNRTLVPVRAISEAFGTTVNWNDSTHTVSIITKKTPVERIEFDGSTDTLTVGESKELHVNIYPQDAIEKDLQWSSSNTSVVTVDSGKITGVDVGTADIICKIDDKTTKCTISVTPKDIAIEIELEKNLPRMLNDYNDEEDIKSTVEVTDFAYEVSGNTLTLYFSGEKLDDEKGEGHSSPCKIGWKLFDEEGYVVKSGTCYSANVAINEKFRNAKDVVPDVMPGKYYLKLTHTE